MQAFNFKTKSMISINKPCNHKKPLFKGQSQFTGQSVKYELHIVKYDICHYFVISDFTPYQNKNKTKNEVHSDVKTPAVFLKNARFIS